MPFACGAKHKVVVLTICIRVLELPIAIYITICLIIAVAGEMHHAIFSCFYLRLAFYCALTLYTYLLWRFFGYSGGGGSAAAEQECWLAVRPSATHTLSPVVCFVCGALWLWGYAYIAYVGCIKK